MTSCWMTHKAAEVGDASVRSKVISDTLILGWRSSSVTHSHFHSVGPTGTALKPRALVGPIVV